MNVRKPMSNTLETTILLGAMIAMIIGGLANAAVTDFAELLVPLTNRFCSTGPKRSARERGAAVPQLARRPGQASTRRLYFINSDTANGFMNGTT